MGILPLPADERVVTVTFAADAFSLWLGDGRTISVPLARYRELFHASHKQRNHWPISGGGGGIHWPELDKDLHTEGLLRGARAPRIATKA